MLMVIDDQLLLFMMIALSLAILFAVFSVGEDAHATAGGTPALHFPNYTF
jgi:hypothetical protein